MNTRPPDRNLVVVGYDGSPAAVRALDWAAAEAKRRQAPLAVIHALDHLAGFPRPVAGTTWPSLNPLSTIQVAEAGARHARRTAGIEDVTPVTMVAPAAFALIRSSRDAGLLVLGGQSGSPGGSSIALAVSQHAACPVVVVRGESAMLPGPQRQIVVGADGSPGSHAALGFAAELAASTGAALTVATAFRTGLVQIWAGAMADTLERAGLTMFDSVAHRAACVVASAAAEAVQQDHPQLQIHDQVVEGPVDRVLNVIAANAGLLVVGSRGLGGFGELLLGSVSRKVIGSAPCPVAVVHGYAQPAEGSARTQSGSTLTRTDPH